MKERQAIKISKTELTKKLENEIWSATSKLGVFGCFEVTIGFNGRERVDYMTMDTKGIFRCYEIKVSKSDFYSKAKHTFEGHFNYYVVTDELYQEIKEEIPREIGVYVLQDNSYVVCKKNPKRQEISSDNVQILKSSMIRSLYREYEKSRDSSNKYLMENLKNREQRLERENRKLQIENTKLSNKLFSIKYDPKYSKYINEKFFKED